MYRKESQKVKARKNASSREKVENRRKTVKNYRKKKLKNARTRVVEKKVENCKNCKKCKKCGKS